jgi:predicted permease
MPFSIRPRVRRAFRLALRRPDLTDEEIDEELSFHVESRIEQLMARGLTREDATRAARERFGAPWPDTVSRLRAAGRRREERLDLRERLEALWHDVRYAARTLVRQRGFALVVIATFALGIGANATMFGVIDRLLLRAPSGVGDAGSLGLVTIAFPGSSDRDHSVLHYPVVTALRADSSVFSDVAAMTDPNRYTLGRGANAEEIFGTVVSGSFFTTLRARPALGRFFGPDDDRDVSPGTLVLSNGFWMRRFGGDKRVIGTTLQIGPRYFTVVGVAQRGFTGIDPHRVDMWIPLGSAGELRQINATWMTDWGSYWIHTVARVRPGVPAALATAHASAAYVNGRNAFRVAMKRTPDSEPYRIELRSVLPAEQIGRSPEARIARLLGAVTVIVLLIGCANVANLLLARGTERRREIAVRLALGVSRRRLMRLLLAETSLLAVIGGGVALLVALAGVRLLQTTLLDDFDWTERVIDPRLVIATSALVAITALIAGVVPALSASRPNVTEALKAGGREGSVRRSRVSTALIVMQAALSVVLLVGAGLFVTSLRRVAALRLGYETERILSVTTDLETRGYKDSEAISLFREMRARLTAVPGVASVAMATNHPLYLRLWGMSVRVPGKDSLPQATNGGPYSNEVSGDYFATLGLRIVEGRPITDADVAANARVVVLSEPMARAYWPGQTAVGRCVFVGSDSTCATVVGVAENARERVSSDEKRFLIYLPETSKWSGASNVLLVRSRDEHPERLASSIRRTVQSVAPDLPYVEVRPLTSMMARQIRPWRLGATLFALFGALASVIAAVGLYSAISYSVSRRRHEFGVRMALGARIADVVRLVMGQGVSATALGIVVGGAAALLSGRFVAELLFDTSPRSPMVFATVAAAMLAVAVAATLIPAWRASRVDPATALRAD